MDEHAWCRSPARDEAVRAAEDGRPGPLPTLEEAISAITNHDAPPGARVSDRQCASPADTGANTELSRAGQSTLPEPSGGTKCTERERVTERRPVDAGGGGNVTGFTEPAKRSPSLSETGDGQSGLRTERVTLEITGAPGWTVQVHGCDVESVRLVEEAHFDDLAQVSMERDAAIRERDAALAREACLRIKLNAAPAASAAAGTEPMAWGIANPGNPIYGNQKVWTVRATEEIAKDVYHSCDGWVHFPLYAAPQAAKGWLTEKERHWINYCRNNYPIPYAALQCFDTLLARSSPPEVVLPECEFTRLSTHMMGFLEAIGRVKKALAAAGVKVKEAGRE